MTGRIIRGVGGFYYVVSGDRVFVTKAAGILRNRKMKPLVGDLVSFETLEDGTGRITELLPRKSELIRPAVANADRLVLVFSAVNPSPNFTELNRYLISVEDLELPVFLVVTKSNLVKDAGRERILSAFRHTGYPIFFISSVTGEGIEEVGKALEHSVNVFSGPSGVGKSSFLNALVGHEAMEVGELSEKIGRGKNTTRHAELFTLPNETFLLDTPGFTSVDIDFVKPENLALMFHEMIPYTAKCRYPSCRHHKEPDCAVKAAVEAGMISEERYQSYLTMLTHLSSLRRYS